MEEGIRRTEGQSWLCCFLVSQANHVSILNCSVFIQHNIEYVFSQWYGLALLKQLSVYPWHEQYVSISRMTRVKFFMVRRGSNKQGKRNKKEPCHVGLKLTGGVRMNSWLLGE